MIEFTPLRLEHKETVHKYTIGSNRRNCDLTFANLISWKFLYDTGIAELDGFLAFRFYLDGKPVYMLPVGDGCPYSIIESLVQDAYDNHSDFLMMGVCSDAKEEIERYFPGRFRFTCERDRSDYLYLRENLATLRGRKYQAKRNHINKFKSLYPDYEFSRLTPELVGECMKLEEEWKQASIAKGLTTQEYEFRSIETALSNMEGLDIFGGVLRVGGKMVGFTYGAMLNSETFDTCAEKADTGYEGAYAVINYEFARSLPEQFKYINREEDLGIEGLRKAKLSYCPEVILDKFKMELA